MLIPFLPVSIAYTCQSAFQNIIEHLTLTFVCGSYGVAL